MSKTVTIEEIFCEGDDGFVAVCKHECIDNDLVVHKKLRYLINSLLNEVDMLYSIEAMKHNKGFVFIGKRYEDYDTSDCVEITFPPKYKSFVEELAGICAENPSSKI